MISSSHLILGSKDYQLKNE